MLDLHSAVCSSVIYLFVYYPSTACHCARYFYLSVLLLRLTSTPDEISPTSSFRRGFTQTLDFGPSYFYSVGQFFDFILTEVVPLVSLVTSWGLVLPRTMQVLSFSDLTCHTVYRPSYLLSLSSPVPSFSGQVCPKSVDVFPTVKEVSRYLSESSQIPPFVTIDYVGDTPQNFYTRPTIHFLPNIPRFLLLLSVLSSDEVPDPPLTPNLVHHRDFHLFFICLSSVLDSLDIDCSKTTT